MSDAARKTVTITCPHRLSREEARSRIQSGIGQARAQFAGQLAGVEERWNDYRMDFRVSVLGQGLTGRVDVLAEAVRIDIDLPWVLAMLAEKIRGQVQQRATKLLGKK